MATGQKVISEILADFVVGVRYQDLPADVIEKTRQLVLDQFGCQLLGSTLSWNCIAYEFVKDMGGRPEGTIVNYGTKALAHDAAYVNGTFGQGAELDDYLTYRMQPASHPGSLCVPIALALGERDKLNGQDFLLSVAVGYQVAWAMSMLMPGMSDRGFHNQSVGGIFTATAATAKLLGLNKAELVNAFGIAGSHASGTLEYDQSGGEVKRFHTGIAIRGGMQSAMLARYGLTGPSTIFEGKRGICTLYAAECHREVLEKELGGDWGVRYGAPKMYPCVGTLQSTLDVMSDLVAKHKIDPMKVEKIEVNIMEHALKHGAAIVEPHDTLSAQFSLAFSIAVRILKGSNDLKHYMDEKLWHDPMVLRLAHAVEVHGDPQMVGPRKRASRVRMTFTDGSKLEGSAEVPKGVFGNPFSRDEIVEKFMRLATTAIPASQAEKIIPKVEALEKLAEVSELVPLLVKRG